ncbi:MAG: aminoacyl--tRNA ligase-related protein [Paracoccaceae bacterium]
MSDEYTLIVDYPHSWVDSQACRKDVSEQIHYVSESIEGFSFRDEGLILSLNKQIDVNKDDVISAAAHILETCSATAARTQDEILEIHETALTPPENPLESLLNSGQVHFNSEGVPVFEGDFKTLLDRLDRLFLAYAQDIGCLEQTYATTVPTDSLLSNGYLKSFPQHAMLVGTVHQDLNSLGAIAQSPDLYSSFRDVDGLIDRHAQMLSPTVCYHCFERHRNSRLGVERRLITAIGKCHRYEGRNTAGLTRLRTYTMREIMYFGEKDFVTRWQLEILEFVKAILAEFGMTYRISVASDPFFSTSAAQKKEFQRVFRLKYELQVLIPQENTWISVASFNNHQQSLTAAYDMKAAQEGDTLHSGCFGVGYERLAYSLVAQLGISPENWPGALKT